MPGSDLGRSLETNNGGSKRSARMSFDQVLVAFADNQIEKTQGIRREALGMGSAKHRADAPLAIVTSECVRHAAGLRRRRDKNDIQIIGKEDAGSAWP